MTLKKDIKNLIDTYQNNRFSPLLKHRKVNFSKTAGFRGVSNVISGSEQIYKFPEQPFTPTSISNCVEYCISDDANLSGNPVQTLINLGSSGINYAQATEASRPTTATINGKKYILFEPTKFLQTPATVNLTGYSKASMVLAIQTYTSVETGTTAWGASSSNYFINLTRTGTSTGWASGIDTDGTVNACSGSTLSFSTTYIFGTTWDPAQSPEVTKFKINNTEDPNRVNYAFGQNTVLANLFHFLNGVNGISDDGYFFYRGHALYGSALSDTEFTNLYNFFTAQMP